MENATHDHQAPSNNPEFLGKAGWVKKAPCRLLASYKDSYIHVDKTAIAVYQNEDLTNCIESLDLQNYDKCHELKSRLMRKHRLILIRSPKTANETGFPQRQGRHTVASIPWWGGGAGAGSHYPSKFSPGRCGLVGH
ncbi:pleckstrin homology domain-containing family O member 2 isoform X4 [Syngnathus acus]|uniref:pleckstrin homology domain-containing family O member 2 isoform X4 n=1 Tax=Syngnathus acus TaxID=161584 RepID=UPI001885AFB8|nr:pleckstrin homology domain-containing family O member 2 isoform X4 [Syngnathus acus]